MAILLSEYEQLNSLPISLIRQHCFCPRIPFYREQLNIQPKTRIWQQQGVDFHQRQQMLNKRRLLSRYGLEQGELIHNIVLTHSELNIHGICDAAIITSSEVIPLEFKLQAAAPVRGHKLQLLAYGLALENRYSLPAQRGFILYGARGKTQLLEFTPSLRQSTTATIQAIQNNLQRGMLPFSSASAAQCGQCEYLNFCGDRDD